MDFDEYYRAEALNVIANKLPETLLPQALQGVLNFQEEWRRAQALSALVGKLPEPLLSHAFKVALNIQDEQSRFHAFSTLADKLPESFLHQALQAALNFIELVLHHRKSDEYRIMFSPTSQDSNTAV